jgi:hypothetical protein
VIRLLASLLPIFIDISKDFTMSTNKSTTNHESKECFEGSYAPNNGDGTFPRNAVLPDAVFRKGQLFSSRSAHVTPQFNSILENSSVDNDADDEETVETSSLRHGTDSGGCEEGFYHVCWSPPSVPEYKMQHNRRKVESLQAEINHLTLQNTRLRQQNQILDKNMTTLGSTNDATLQTLQRRCAIAEATSANLSREIEKISREEDALKIRNKELEGQLESLLKRLQNEENEIIQDHRNDHCARGNLEQEIHTNQQLPDSLMANTSEVVESLTLENDLYRTNKDNSLACDKAACVETHDGEQQQCASSYSTEKDTHSKEFEQKLADHGLTHDVQKRELVNPSYYNVEQRKEMKNGYCQSEQKLSAANLQIKPLSKVKQMTVEEHNIAINDLVERYEDEHQKCLEWHEHEKQRWTSQYEDQLELLKTNFETENSDLVIAHSVEVQNIVKNYERSLLKITENKHCRNENLDRLHEKYENESNDRANAEIHGPIGNLGGLTRCKFHQIEDEKNVDRCDYGVCEIEIEECQDAMTSIKHKSLVAHDVSNARSTDLSLSDDENGAQGPERTKVMQASTHEFEIVLDDRQMHLLALGRWTSKLEAQMEETRSQMQVLKDVNLQFDPALVSGSEEETAIAKQPSALVQQHAQELSDELAEVLDLMQTPKRKIAAIRKRSATPSVPQSDSSSGTKNTDDTLNYTSSDDESDSIGQDAIILALEKRLQEQDISITTLRRDIHQLRRNWGSMSSLDHTLKDENVCVDESVENTGDKTNGRFRPEQQREAIDVYVQGHAVSEPEMVMDDENRRQHIDLAQHDSLSESMGKPNARFHEMVNLEQEEETLLLKIDSLENDLVLERNLKMEIEKRFQTELQKEQQWRSYNKSALEAQLHKSEKDRQSLESLIERLQKELHETRPSKEDGIDRQATRLCEKEKVLEDANLVPEPELEKDTGKLFHEIQVLRRQLKAHKLGWEDARMTIRELEKSIEEREAEKESVRKTLYAEIESLTCQLDELKDKLDLDQLEREIINDFQDSASQPGTIRAEEKDNSFLAMDNTDTTTKDSSLTMCHEKELEYLRSQLQMANDEIAIMRHLLKVENERRNSEIFALEQQLVLLSVNNNNNNSNSRSGIQEKSSRIFPRVGKPRRVSIWKPL